MKQKPKWSPGRGGHAPGFIREAMLAWLDDEAAPDWQAALTSPRIAECFEFRRRALWDAMSNFERAEWLTGQLYNCCDQLPRDVREICEGFGITCYSYAQISRALRSLLGISRVARIEGAPSTVTTGLSNSGVALEGMA